MNPTAVSTAENKSQQNAQILVVVVFVLFFRKKKNQSAAVQVGDHDKLMKLILNSLRVYRQETEKQNGHCQ